MKNKIIAIKWDVGRLQNYRDKKSSNHIDARMPENFSLVIIHEIGSHGLERDNLPDDDGVMVIYTVTQI